MPSIVPEAGRQWPQYFVLCDYGPKLGLSWYELDPDTASNRDLLIRWLCEGQFSDPVQILEVDLPAGTCRDVSTQFAEAVRFRSGGREEHIALHTRRFVERAA